MRRLCVRLTRPGQQWGLREVGKRFDPGWRAYFTAVSAAAGTSLPPVDVSPWHTLPLQVAHESSSGASSSPLVFTYVNEIPKATLEKLEISTKLPLNPIVQDTVKKTGSLRCFTYGRLPFNYGCAPRTWEDPKHVDPRTGCAGDGDPVDIVELSLEPLTVGAVVAVRVLGVLGLIDEGETDWKILAIREDDTAVKALRDLPSSTLATIQNWFRNYKTTDGKPQNEFWDGGKIHDDAVALDVLRDCHAQYSRLMSGQAAGSESANKLWLR